MTEKKKEARFASGPETCVGLNHRFAENARVYAVIIENTKAGIKRLADMSHMNEAGEKVPVVASLRAVDMFIELVERCMSQCENGVVVYLVGRELENGLIFDYLVIFEFRTEPEVFNEEETFARIVESNYSHWKRQKKETNDDAMCDDDDYNEDDNNMADEDIYNDGVVDSLNKMKINGTNGKPDLFIGENWHYLDLDVPIKYDIITHHQWNPIAYTCNKWKANQVGQRIGQEQSESINDRRFHDSTLGHAFGLSTILYTANKPVNSKLKAPDGWALGIPPKAAKRAYIVNRPTVVRGRDFRMSLLPVEPHSDVVLKSVTDKQRLSFEDVMSVGVQDHSCDRIIDSTKSFVAKQFDALQARINAKDSTFSIADRDRFRLMTRDKVIQTLWITGVFRGTAMDMSVPKAACIKYAIDMAGERNFMTSLIKLTGKIASDLSLTSSVIAQIMYVYETVIGITDNHIPLFILSLAALTSLGESDMQPMNVLWLSKPGAGKSHAMRVLGELMTSGTIEAFTDLSNAAFHLTEQKRGVCRTLSELPKFAMLPETSANDPKLKAFLEIMAGGGTKLTYSMVKYVDGERSRDTTVNDACGAVLAASNEEENKFVPAFLNRCFVLNFLNYMSDAQARSNGRHATAHAIATDKTPRATMINDEFAWIWRRAQWGITILDTLERCGVIPPVDMTAANYYINELSRRCADRSVVIDDKSRSLQMARRAIETLVKFMAILLTFDYEESPFYAKNCGKLDPENFQWVNYALTHWAASTEHIVPILSMFLYQWEPNDWVSRHLLRSTFANTIEFDIKVKFIAIDSVFEFKRALQYASFIDNQADWKLDRNKEKRLEIAKAGIAIAAWIDTVYERFTLTRTPGTDGGELTPDSDLKTSTRDHMARFNGRHLKLLGEYEKIAALPTSYRTLVFVRYIIGLRTHIDSGDRYGVASKRGQIAPIEPPNDIDKTLLRDPGSVYGSGLMDFHVECQRRELASETKNDPDGLARDLEQIDIDDIPGGDMQFGPSAEDQRRATPASRKRKARLSYERSAEYLIRDSLKALVWSDEKIDQLVLFQRALHRRELLVNEKWFAILYASSLPQVKNKKGYQVRLAAEMFDRACNQSCGNSGLNETTLEKWINEKSFGYEDSVPIRVQSGQYRVSADQLLTFEVSVVNSTLQSIMQFNGDVTTRHVIFKNNGEEPFKLMTIPEYASNTKKSYPNPDKIGQVPLSIIDNEIGDPIKRVDVAATKIDELMGLRDEGPVDDDAAAPAAVMTIEEGRPNEEEEEEEEEEEAKAEAPSSLLPPSPMSPMLADGDRSKGSSLPLPPRSRLLGKKRKHNDQSDVGDDPVDDSARSRKAEPRDFSDDSKDDEAFKFVDFSFEDDDSEEAKRKRELFSDPSNAWLRKPAHENEPQTHDTLTTTNISGSSFVRSLRRSGVGILAERGLHTPDARARFGADDGRLKPYPACFDEIRTAHSTGSDNSMNIADFMK